MTLLSLIWIVGAAAPGDNAPAVNLTILAVHATQEPGTEKRFDPALEPIRDVLEPLSFNRFQLLNRKSVSVKLSEEASLALTEDYTLILKPLSREAEGQVRIEARIEMPSKKEGDKPVTALATTVRIEPGKQFLLRGLKLDPGELLVVVGPEETRRTNPISSALRLW